MGAWRDKPTDASAAAPFMASISFANDTRASLPAVFGSAAGVTVLPVARSTGGTVAGSSSADNGLGSTVSWQEYHRVCTNEQTLTDNVATLKALVLQLAAQLSQAQEELHLLERSVSSPATPSRAGGEASPQLCRESRRPSSPGVEDAAKTPEAARQELMDIIARKDRTIYALQQQLSRQSTRFNAELDELARVKNAMIEELALELDTLRCSKR